MTKLKNKTNNYFGNLNETEIDKVSSTFSDLDKITEVMFKIALNNAIRVLNGESVPPSNILAYGHTGCGKTAASICTACKLMGVSKKEWAEASVTDDGISLFFREMKINGKNHVVALLQMHGATLDPFTTNVPSVKKSYDHIPEKVLNYMQVANHAQKDGDLVKQKVYEEAAFDSFPSHLTSILSEVFMKIKEAGVLMAYILFQDINKNSDPMFNNFLKSIVDGVIGHTALPYTFMVMTANPTGFGYTNIEVDSTIKNTAVELMVEPVLDESIKYATQSFPQLEDFLRTYPEFLSMHPNEEKTTFPTVRGWDTLCCVLKEVYESKSENFLHVVPIIAKGIVGKEVAKELVLWLQTKDFQINLDYRKIIKVPSELAREVNDFLALDMENFTTKILTIDRVSPVHIFYFINELNDSQSKSFLMSAMEKNEFTEGILKNTSFKTKSISQEDLDSLPDDEFKYKFENWKREDGKYEYVEKLSKVEKDDFLNYLRNDLNESCINAINSIIVDTIDVTPF